MFGSLGPGEIILILVVLLLVFGAKRLPELGSALGKGIREFKSSVKDIEGELTSPTPSRPQQVQRPEVQQAVPPPQPQQPVQSQQNATQTGEQTQRQAAGDPQQGSGARS